MPAARACSQRRMHLNNTQRGAGWRWLGMAWFDRWERWVCVFTLRPPLTHPPTSCSASLILAALRWVQVRCINTSWPRYRWQLLAICSVSSAVLPPCRWGVGAVG